MRVITLPWQDNDFLWVKDPDEDFVKWRANKIILGNRYDLTDPKTYDCLIALGIKVDTHRHKILK